VTREEAQKVLDACPCNQWRLLFALARYGGLRTPSESLALTWADINWEKNLMVVRQPKLEHLEGRATRLVPIFPELRPFLEQCFDEAEPGALHVITRYRGDSAVNLRTQLERILCRAGLTAWPKLWQNLRSTRQTELAETMPMHKVCKMIGNSPLVANTHYLQVRDEDYERAASVPTGAMPRALQNALQQPSERSRNGQQPKVPEPVISEGFETLRDCASGAMGGE
jgi:hypothetical protein